MDKTCGTCRWALLGVQGDPEHGICRRYPPNHENRWPEVMAYDLCGEHTPKEPPHAG